MLDRQLIAHLCPPDAPVEGDTCPDALLQLHLMWHLHVPELHHLHRDDFISGRPASESAFSAGGLHLLATAVENRLVVCGGDELVN